PAKPFAQARPCQPIGCHCRSMRQIAARLRACRGEKAATEAWAGTRKTLAKSPNPASLAACAATRQPAPAAARARSRHEGRRPLRARRLPALGPAADLLEGGRDRAGHGDPRAPHRLVVRLRGALPGLARRLGLAAARAVEPPATAGL